MRQFFDYSAQGEPLILKQYLVPGAPRLLVEVGAGDGITNSLSRGLVEEDWQAVLVEEDPALFRQLSRNYEQYPKAICVNAQLGSPRNLAQPPDKPGVLTARFLQTIGFETAPLQTLRELLAKHSVGVEIGLLILHRKDPVLTGAILKECSPWLIVVEDDRTQWDEHRRKYEHLVGNGCRFSGVVGEYSVWTSGRNEPREIAIRPVHLPEGVVRSSGRAAFDHPIDRGASRGLYGASYIVVMGWAFDSESFSVPPLVYLELKDRRSGDSEYFQGYRYSRPDVASVFQQPQLSMAGFRAVIPLRSHRTGTYTVSVVQADETSVYFSEAELGYPPALEQFEQTAREGLARKFLYGSGIEIGALQRRLPLPDTATVRYLDRFGINELMSHYPELNGTTLQPPDLIDDGETLGTIAEGSQDFLVANHFFEHCENPILALQNLLNKLREGGILYMAIPDKRYTFDSERPSTSYDALRSAYLTGSRSCRDDLFYEWARYVESYSCSDAKQRAEHLLATSYSIHYNVWTADELLQHLFRARSEFGLPFQIASVVCSENETILVLRKSLLPS